MFKRGLAGFGLALILAVGGAAAAEKVVMVDGVSVRVPLPEGTCEATGIYADFAARAASLDTAHETLLTVMPCAEMNGKPAGPNNRYGVLKWPLGSSAETVPRKDMVAQYRANPAVYDQAAQDGANSPSVQKKAQQFDKDAKVSVGLKPVGVDDNGIYLAGVISVSVDPQAPPIFMVASFSVTEVKGRMLLWYAYGPGDTAGAMAEQAAIVKAATGALVKAN